MICKKCGNTLKEGAKFCNACGAPVHAQPAPIPSTAPVNREDTGYTIPLVREAAPVQNAAPVSKKPFPVKKLLLAVAAVAVVVLVVVLASSLFGGKTVYLLTEHMDYDESFSKYTVTYEYDDDGNMVEYRYQVKYLDWYSDYLDDIDYTWSYEYEDGRIVAAEYDGDDLSFELEYIYDKKGNLETVESDDFEGEVTCDDKGRIIEMEFDGDIEESLECSYYDNGMIKELEYTSGSFRYVILYSETGKTLESTTYDDGEKFSETTNEYDDKDRHLEYEYKYYYNGKLSSSTHKTWEYDKKGNLVAFTMKRTSDGDKLTMECDVVTDGDTKEYVITKLSGDKEAFSSITKYLEKGDVYMEETYDEHGNCVEQIIYGSSENELTWEYQEFKVSKNFIDYNPSAPQFCQFLD